jgi:hypothetical protein
MAAGLQLTHFNNLELAEDVNLPRDPLVYGLRDLAIEEVVFFLFECFFSALFSGH